MAKRDVTAFLEGLLPAAERIGSKIYMTRLQIAKLRDEEKRLNKQYESEAAKEKEKNKRKWAELIMKARQEKAAAEKPLQGFELEADVRAKRMQEGLPAYTTEKTGEFTFGYKGAGGKEGGAKAATEAQWLTALRGNEDDRRAIVDKMRGSIDMDSKLQVAVDATAEFEKAETYEDLNAAYNKVMTRLDAIAKEGKVQLPLVDASKNDLARYKILAQDRIWYNEKLGRTSGTIKAPAGTDEDKIFDEIIETVK